MPARDGTGPFGTGQVGRGLGPCRGSALDRGTTQPGMGMGYRRGWGGGNRQLRRGATIVEENQQILHNQQSWLQDQLEAVKRKLAELGNSSES